MSRFAASFEDLPDPRGRNAPSVDVDPVHCRCGDCLRRGKLYRYGRFRRYQEEMAEDNRAAALWHSQP